MSRLPNWQLWQYQLIICFFEKLLDVLTAENQCYVLTVIYDCLSAGALWNLLITCRFSAFFLVVSIKKRTFAEKFNV